MSFATKTDPFEIVGNAGVLECVAVSDNASATLVEAHDENGSYVAHELCGEQIAPSADYKVKKDGNVSATLGAVTTYSGKRVVLTSLTINTSQGGETTVSASGEEVETATTGTCPAQFETGDIAVGVCYHARIIQSAFAVGGAGCHLQSANYTFGCSLGKTTKDAATIAHGVYEGYAEGQIEIIQTGTTDPTLTIPNGSDWFISSPLSKVNPDADYPTWTATVRKHLTMTTPSAATPSAA